MPVHLVLSPLRRPLLSIPKQNEPIVVFGYSSVIGMLDGRLQGIALDVPMAGEFDRLTFRVQFDQPYQVGIIRFLGDTAMAFSFDQGLILIYGINFPEPTENKSEAS